MCANLNEIEHRYGEQIHILSSSTLSTLLCELSQNKCIQPKINQLIDFLYLQLLTHVIDQEFPVMSLKTATRMEQYHPGKLLTASVVDQNQRVVVVNLARAGTLPSHVCYNALNYLLPPAQIRQDHIMAARLVDDDERVTQSQFGASKIGGGIDNAFVLFPDPMGATGNTLATAIETYKSQVKGSALKFIALHLIITPEYLKKVTIDCPELIVYSLRLDRGLSGDDVLLTVPGTHWDREKGLNNKDYIVPGAGGLGEILNNSFV